MNMMLVLLFAAVPLHWAVETSRVQPAQIEAYHGETLNLSASLQSYGKPLAITNSLISVYWQTNGMGSAYWSAPAALSNNVMLARWTPAMDVGANVYQGFIGVPGEIYRAAFQLRLRPSPGAVPSELPIPAKVIDFAQVETLNAPWFTKDESNGRFSTKTETGTKIASATNGLESAAHAAQTYQVKGQYLTSESDPSVSATNPTFSNAVLAVGLNIDTNSVAVLNEIAATFGGFPIEGTATSVGGLLLALAAAVAWLRKNKLGKTETIPQSQVEGLANALAGKLDKSGGELSEGAEIHTRLVPGGTSYNIHFGAHRGYENAIWVTDSEGNDVFVISDHITGNGNFDFIRDGLGGSTLTALLNQKANVSDFSTSMRAQYVTEFVQKSVRYQEVTPSNTTLAEACINVLTTAGQTYTLPTLATGESRVRDLLLYVSTSATAFAINFPTGTQLLGDNPSITEAGEYIITMTAMPSGKWYVRKIKMEVAQ